MPTVEQVINKPLTGEELKRIVLNKLADKLNGDTRLADYIAVPSFQFRLDLVMMLNGAVHDDIRHTVEGKQGKVDEDASDLRAESLHIEQGEMPPNEVRVDAGLEVPVMSHDEKGRPVEKGVKYAKEQIRKARPNEK
jgi:hypothetical protein